MGHGAPRYVNQSELTTFMRCPRKWYWAYKQGYDSKDPGANLALGSAVHSILQSHYRGDSWEDCINGILDEQALKETPSFDLKLLEAMIEGYFQWLEETGADAFLTPVVVEQKIEMPLGTIRGKEVVLHGTVDLAQVDGDDRMFLTDHKTTASFEILANRRMAMSFQLQTYAMLLEHRTGRYPSGAIYNMLRKVKRTGNAKPPFFMRETVAFNIHQREAFKGQIRQVVNAMLELEDRGDALPYPVVDQDCGWKCPFIGICSMADDGSDIEGVLNDLYSKKS